MEIKLQIKQMLPLQTGVSKSGNNWSKQAYVGETLEQYPKQVYFYFFGNDIPQQPLVIGNCYVVRFDVESRSYVGKDGVERWSTDVRAYAVSSDVMEGQQPAQAQQQNYDAQAAAFFGDTQQQAAQQPWPSQWNQPAQQPLQGFQAPSPAPGPGAFPPASASRAGAPGAPAYPQPEAQGDVPF